MLKSTYSFGAVAILLAAPFFAPVSRAEAAPAKDPFVGTWVRDFGKSNFERVAVPQKKTITVAPLDNGLSLKETIVNANGGTDSLQFMAKFDGKTYDAPSESPLSKVSFRRVDPDTLEQTGINRNKPVETVRFQIGNAGKMLTVTTADPGNPAINLVQVFDRQ